MNLFPYPFRNGAYYQPFPFWKLAPDLVSKCDYTQQNRLPPFSQSKISGLLFLSSEFLPEAAVSSVGACHP